MGAGKDHMVPADEIMKSFDLTPSTPKRLVKKGLVLPTMDPSRTKPDRGCHRCDHA